MLIQMMFASVSAIGQSGKCYIIELPVQCMQIKEELILLVEIVLRTRYCNSRLYMEHH